MYNKELIIKTMNEPKIKSVIKAPKHFIDYRGISADTMKFFDVRCLVDSNARPDQLIFPYNKDAQKIRYLKEKDFTAAGDMKSASLFGMDKFVPGQNMSITITEGELDALSVFQMLGSKYPVVSCRSSSTAGTDCKLAHEYLNAFDRIYICMDGDAPGQKAATEIAKLFNPNKIYIVKLGEYKDPNEMLQAGRIKEFVNCWYNSRRFQPFSVKSTWEEMDAILSKRREAAMVEYPFPTLQEMTYGIYSKQLIAILAQEKIGKTEFIRTIEHHILKNTDANIGIIHLEEDEQRTVQGLVGLHMEQPVHLPDCMVSVPDQQKAFKELTKTDGRVHIYPHFGSDDPNTILEILRYMVSVLESKYIFLDHITMLVTGFEGDDERKKLDYLSTKFGELTRELDFTMFLISHVNDDGKTRGSRNITKMADLIISLNRDIEAQDENARNTTYVNVRGNRFSGRTGPAGVLRFDPRTYRIDELTFANDNWPEDEQELLA